MKKKSLMGLVWTGFSGEYNKPPIYIIKKHYGFKANTVFISDFLKPFVNKKVRITIEEV